MENNLFRNFEGYLDPTAGLALSQITREEQGRVYRPLVYVCSRFAGDVSRNVRAARKYCKFVVRKNALPLAPHLLYPQFLDDKNPEERKLGMTFSKILMDKCNEVWIFSDDGFSSGMRAEYEHAVRKGCMIRYFTTDCRETTTIGNGGKRNGGI